MKKIITLKESDLIKVIKKIIIESRYNDQMEEETVKYVSELIDPYVDSNAIKFSVQNGYLIIDIETPTFFQSVGFPYKTPHNIKNKLRNKGFLGIGNGKYVRKLT